MRFAAAAGAMLVIVAACSESKSKPSSESAAATPTGAATSGSPTCPPTGRWAQCSVMYSLERAGVAPKLDSADVKPEEKLLTGQMFVAKIGANARLEVYLYPDSAARIADEKLLDRTHFVSDSAEQTIKRERTLIESANLVALLTSLNSHQRQRVADAITVGPPQPKTP